MEMTQSQITTLMQGLSDFMPQATKWEQEFFGSVRTQFEKRNSLSSRQIELLQKIANKFSPEAVRERETWYESWTTEKAEILRVCADYYMETGYFRDVCHKVKVEEGFVPSPKLFKAMCENKYASKVLEAYRAEPKFPAGSLATLRKAKQRSIGYLYSPVYDTVEPEAEIQVLVLSTDEPIVSAAKGCKRYQVVAVGSSKPFLCEERDIKTLKRTKK